MTPAGATTPARRAMRAAALVAVLGAGGTVVLSLLQDRFIYHPDRVVDRTPADFGLIHEEIRLLTKDGIALTGWYLPVQSPIATVLFLHGNAGNASSRLHHVPGFARCRLSWLLIDYRGYGLSTGEPSEEGLYIDARTAWDHLIRERGLAPGRVVLYGESLGAAPALRLAADLSDAGAPAPGAILLEGAFTSVPDVGRHAFPFLPVAWLLRSRFDNLTAIGKVSAPTLFIHGSRDEVIPLSMARRLFDASPAQLKRLREVAGAGHNTVWLEEAPALYEEIAGFLSDARITR